MTSPGRALSWSSDATDSAPAGSAMMPSFWYRSSCATHTAPSGAMTVWMRERLRSMIWYGRSPSFFTAAPSTKGSTEGSSTGSSAAIAAVRHAAPAGSTATTAVRGDMSAK